MRAWSLALAVLPALGGCATHAHLRDSTARTAATLTDLNYRQVLDNVARFAADPSALPAVAVVNSGTVTATDRAAYGANATYAPTLPFAQQGGGALPILSLFFNPSGQRQLTENWSVTPVTDVDALRRIRCAFQLLVLRGGQTGDCADCRRLVEDFFLGESDRLDCRIPAGWYCTGGRPTCPATPATSAGTGAPTPG